MTGAMCRGGAERVISVLSNYYAECGHDVEICMLLHNDISYMLDERISVVNLSDDSVSLKKGMLSLLSRVRGHVKKSSPDVVVSFMAQIAFISGLAMRGMSVRHIASERIDPSQVSRSGMYKKLLYGIYERLDALVLQTERAYAYFPEKIQKNSVIIPNPIEVKALASGERKKRIVTAGRLEPQKNHKMLINAFLSVRERYPDYTLDIYGDGTLADELRAFIDERGATDCIRLMGNSPEIHKEISDAELFVLSSDFEGLSNALLEAMMMGLPVISTDCSGSDEVIRDGENGLLVSVGDGDALAAAIDRMLSSDSLRRKLGDAARLSAERFKTENVINQWNSVILR